MPATRLKCRSSLSISFYALLRLGSVLGVRIRIACAAAISFSVFAYRFNTPPVYTFISFVLSSFFLLAFFLSLVLSTYHLNNKFNARFGPCDGERSRDRRIITTHEKRKKEKRPVKLSRRAVAVESASRQRHARNVRTTTTTTHSGATDRTGSSAIYKLIVHRANRIISSFIVDSTSQFDFFRCRVRFFFSSSFNIFCFCVYSVANCYTSAILKFRWLIWCASSNLETNN